MRFRVVRLLNGELDEEQGKEREDGGLEESDEYLEHHERHGEEVRREVNGDGDDYLARQDVAEEPKRERYDAYQLADELDEPHGEADGISERILNEFAAVLPETDGENARHFDDKEGYDSEYERHGEVGIRRAQKRLMVVLERADTRYEVQHVAHENEKKYRHEERKEFARHIAAFECFRHVVVHESDHCLHERLELSGNHFELTAHEECDRDQNRDDEPTRNQRVGDGNPEKFSELFSRYGDVYAFLHAG